MVNNKIELATEGFLIGCGVDAIMKGIARKLVPLMAQPSPIKIPGYDTRGVHYDDLITLGAFAFYSINGYIEGNEEKLIKGLSGLVGSYILSTVFQK